jgi:hypothetical protein
MRALLPLRPVDSVGPSTFRRTLFAGLSVAGLLLLCSQMTCAEVANYWNVEDPQTMKKDGGGSDGGDDIWRCYMGTPTKESELLDRCTEAERIDRASAIPAATWDSKSPLPFQ